MLSFFWPDVGGKTVFGFFLKVIFRSLRQIGWTELWDGVAAEILLRFPEGF